MTARALPTAASAASILEGPQDPSMLTRPRPVQGHGPISGDVLRGLDTYSQAQAPGTAGDGHSLCTNNKLSHQVSNVQPQPLIHLGSGTAGLASSGGGPKKSKKGAQKKVPINEEVFRTDEERHQRWSHLLSIMVASMSP